MRADFRVLLDACVLAPANLCDLVLSLAESPRLFLPFWSEDILAEVHRTQIDRLKWPKHLADFWQKQVRASFPEALVSDYAELIAVCENDPKDRHVLAAAIKSSAAMIVTTNLKHFPKKALEKWGMSAVHPSTFLHTLYGMDAGVVVSKLEEIARRRTKSPQDVLARVGKIVPLFAENVADELGWELPAV